MSTLMLCNSDPAMGHLKQERAAELILNFPFHDLAFGPVPAGDDPEEFLDARRAMFAQAGVAREGWWFDGEATDPRTGRPKRRWRGLPQIGRSFDRVVLWIDPDANAQLLLIQLLDWLGRDPEIRPRLWLRQLETPGDERRPGTLALPPVAVTEGEIALARRAWKAFREPTPRAWAALLDDPATTTMPGVLRAVRQLLAELPGPDGLGESERRVLLASAHRWFDGYGRTSLPIETDDDRLVGKVIGRVLHHGEELPVGYWDIGRMLCGLAAAPVPALAGIDERDFTLDMHDDTERHARFRHSRVVLTPFGRRLLDGTEDWSRHNPIDRWWGGTHLTNAHLWRWDREGQRLIAPET
ncbi:hypothetical protein FHR90_000957 [Endobacter medicaginis]|uniref:DUF1835 domain-containing protein n=1 Tax=Endobacter medicaginis TaxID=1181271 RepID=A0A839V0R7_9PROT|nr:hypothetical protein [Endobacter medicaginis]MBB3173139.1 hypothetical protein [Endobacter medicaginis]MCX5476969.1 hypothetical protein [Endobacter medicaginis]NVN31686.1 hypothetical protein [Endobacter medicaginis]